MVRKGRRLMTSLFLDLFSCRGFGNVLVEVIIGKVDKKNGSLEERDEVVDIDAGGIILFYTSG